MAGAAAASPSPAGDGDKSAAEQFSSAFYRTRLLTFAAMFVGYGSYYLTRNSLSYVAPTLLNDKLIGLTMTQIGGLTSILPVCYGACLPLRHAVSAGPRRTCCRKIAAFESDSSIPAAYHSHRRLLACSMPADLMQPRAHRTFGPNLGINSLLQASPSS